MCVCVGEGGAGGGGSAEAYKTPDEAGNNKKPRPWVENLKSESFSEEGCYDRRRGGGGGAERQSEHQWLVRGSRISVSKLRRSI